MRVTNNPEEIGKCGCGRSPNGKCIGWHALNGSQLKEAMNLWTEKCKIASSSEMALDQSEVALQVDMKTDR